jgi:hypothetical protein
MVTFENILRHQFVFLKEKMKGELKAQTEKTETDRKRERRVKKYMKRKRQKERARREKLVQKLNPGLGNKYSNDFIHSAKHVPWIRMLRTIHKSLLRSFGSKECTKLQNGKKQWTDDK